MDILDARIRRARRSPDQPFVEAVVTLKVRDTLRPDPYEMEVLSFAPANLARRPGALRQKLIEGAMASA